MSTLFFDYLNSSVAMLAAYAGSIDPVGTLYGALAGTYGGAAMAAGADDHCTLKRCYLLSALLHVLIGTCHHFHI